MCHALLNVNVSQTYVAYQLLENKQMLYEMLVSPDRCLQNIRRYSNALTTWYGDEYPDLRTIVHFDSLIFQVYAAWRMVT
jgi:hypothetical protein